MTISDAFQQRLQQTFHGRLRIRWSVRAREWRIEQKVGRAVLPPIRIEEDRDDLICARDGYNYVLSVRHGDRMPCPACDFAELKVPIRDFVDIRCDYCASKGRQGRTVAGYWPLDDTLIQHLQKIDPERTVNVRRNAGKDMAEDVDRANEQLQASLDRAYSTKITGIGSDNYNQMAGVLQFGYSHAKGWPSAGIIPASK